MIVAANYVRDLHVAIIDDHREVIGRRTIGPGNNQIIEFRVLKYHRAPDLVLNHDIAVKRISEADNGANALSMLRIITATAIVAGLLTAFHLSCSELVELSFGAVAMISLALLQPPIDNFFIAIEAVSLKERPLVGLQA